VSIDQLESTHPGRIPVYKGSPSSSSYHAGSLFTDHASRFLHFVPHCSTGAEEAVLAKRLFEHLASTHHRSIKRYHADNGVFTTKLFRDACNSQHQQLTLCGVDAHHQNGIAERFIRTITERARTMLIHAMLCWPDIITEDLWPFAVQLAVDLHNMTPTSTGLSPMEVFTGAKKSFDPSSCHTFGCPIYVLEPTLRQNHKIPRWKPRSRVGIYLGFSPNHASSVPLVLSTTTGLVSPQYHVVFDDNFTTTTSFKENQVPTNWIDLFNSTATCYVDEDFSSTNLYEHSSFEKSSSQRESIQPSSASFPQSQRESSISSSVLPSIIESESTTSATSPPHEGWNSTHRYNTRFRLQHSANMSFHSFEPAYQDPLLDKFLQSHNLQPIVSPTCFQSISHHSLSSPETKDTLHYGEMLQDPDRSSFEVDMRREVNDLLSTGTVSIVSRSSIPSWIRPLQAIWSFRRKRAPDWSILKFKARLCPHGGMQIEGENYWHTYAPVVNWRTVRLSLILSLLSGLKHRQVDYVSAYTQAPLDCELYMNIPPGFIVHNTTLKFSNSSTRGNSNDYLLRLNKNVYGLKQAGNNWFTELRGSLIALGFTQSLHEPCLFIKNDCLVIIYVDDCLFFAKTDDILDSIIAKLSQNFNLTSQGDVGAFLGIDIRRTADGFLELVQPGLIGKIISFVGLEAESNEHKTPATTILHADPQGANREQTWNYRAAIGMLNYLSTSTRPDIAFAVHQCARFSSNPKRIHEIAVRRIVRYLKGTKEKGYILRPSTTRTLDCFVDADFAGLWSSELANDPISVKSRTGYVITFANCPILWSSKLQTEIALSTTEAEYIAMSQSARDLIPMRDLLHEFASATKLIVGDTVTHSTIFEDNRGCVDLANAPKLRPRTKHIGLKYHHFRSHILSGAIKIQWIATKDQLADIFTKPLPFSTFESLRYKLLGW
jgi:hypothetical protein